MLTPEQFVDMDINSMIEVGHLFDGLSRTESVVWVCEERTTHPERGTEVAVFGLFYEDINIGRIRGELLDDGTLDWKQIDG